MPRQGIRQRIKQIADNIHKKKVAGQPCVLLLGAGASISSGIPPTETIIEDILNKHDSYPQKGTQSDRFDKYWSRLPANEREQTMKPYLDKQPSSGYVHLAELIRLGYFKRIITLNFDRLLVTALIDKGQQEHRDFGVVTRNETQTDDAVVQAIEDMKDPPVKILQMHAGLGSLGTLLFNRAEMHEYPEVISKLLKKLTEADVLTVGCSFKDLNITMAFSLQGGKVFSVNPEGVPVNLGAAISSRQSQEFVIQDDYAKFDKFFEALHEDVAALNVPKEKPEFNPFKFLENYGPNDRDVFYGREEEEKEATNLFREAPQKVIHIVGPAKAGKTSFVRARLLPHFEENGMLCIYLRYPVMAEGKLDEWLPEALAGPKRRPEDNPPTASLEDTIKRLARDAHKKSKQIVVVLDDFDRLLGQDAESGRAALVQLAELAGACKGKNLSFLCVGTDDKPYLIAIDRAKKQEKIWLEAFKPDEVRTIIQKLAERADIQFDAEVINEIVSKYAPVKKDEHDDPFTMAHVQALCHLLADMKNVDLAYYDEIEEKQGRGLTAALNVKEFFSSLEDLPDEGRNLLRKVVKFIEGDSKRHIARCVQEHRKDLLPVGAGLANRRGGQAEAGRVVSHA
jgi:NAD-dependent SIR2 family protein deacetylase